MNKELTKSVNAYIANIGVGYIKLHNLHWNVVGSQFKAVHEYLESASISELPDGKVDQKKALEITLADLETLRDQAAAVRALADKDDVFGVANLMEDHIANYAKQIWFLRSMLA